MKEYTVKVFEDRVEWYNQGGQLHRDEGPAIEYNNGTKIWIKYDMFHREDGPAKKWSDGEESWYLDDKEYSKEEYYKELAKRASSCNDKVIEMDGKKYKLVEVE